MVSAGSTSVRPAFARREVLGVAALLFVVLMAMSTRYGYHRDELYFVMLGGHPALGYVDQPPLVPLLAHLMDAGFGGSLAWLRLPAALASAAAVCVTGLIARDLGARRSGQLLAAGGWAMSAVVLAAGHLATTTVFDLLGWTVVSWLLIRALRHGGRWWVWAGLAAGVALEVKSLVVFMLFALLVGIFAVGPRAALRTPWPWLGGLLAVLLWAPDLGWQATHGWPQLQLSSRIASGGSGTSEPRALFLPYQVVLLSPVLVPAWALGWWRLLRDPELRVWRSFAVAYVVLVVVFLATGGKPYYLCGLYPVLLAAGAQPFVDWCRRSVLVVALGIGLVINVLLFVPVLPASWIAGTPVTAINYDAGETVGWPGYVAGVRKVWDALPSREHAAILTANYGEAGSVHRFASDLPVFSGHNSLRSLGRPPSDTDVVVALGYDEGDLRACFRSVHRAATTPTPYGIDNDEAGQPIWVASDPKLPWATIWHRLERTG